MKEIYRNDYGVTYKVENHPNPKNKILIIINDIGLFLSLKELENLLGIVRSSYESSDKCNCEECGGKKFNKLWKANNFIEVSLKVNNSILELLEDLIEGTQFILNLDSVLEAHRIE